jgi:hypothetical protein
MAFVTQGEIRAQLKHVDEPDVVERAEGNRALWFALRQERPPNWWGTGLAPDKITALASSNSIAVAWVPPGPVIQELVAAPASDRSAVLLSLEEDVVADCRKVLAECDDSWLDNDRTLIICAFDAFEAGHHEAAMALGAAVGEPLAAWASDPRVKLFEGREDAQEYEQLRHGLPKSASQDEADSWEVRLAELKKEGVTSSKYGKYSIAAVELRGNAPGYRFAPTAWRRAFISPIPHFFKAFHGREGEPIPELASRHATVHQPTVEHLNRYNALTTLMLVTSILREKQAWAEEVRFMDRED